MATRIKFSDPGSIPIEKKKLNGQCCMIKAPLNQEAKHSQFSKAFAGIISGVYELK